MVDESEVFLQQHEGLADVGHEPVQQADQQHADDGQIVVARIGDEATVKRLRRRNGQVWLLPENDNYEPIDGTEAEIIGLVKAVYREY